MVRKIKRRDLVVSVVSLCIGSIGLISAVILVGNSIFYQISATPVLIPKEVKLSNISPNSATVSFFTDKKSVSSILFSRTKNFAEKQLAYDLRGETTSTSVHYFVLDNLTPQTPYYFKIVSGGTQFDNNDNPYVLTTSKVSQIPPSPPFTIKGETLPNTIVYCSFPGSTLLSTLPDINNRYLFTLNNALTKDLTKNYVPQKGEKAYIHFQTLSGSKTQEITVEDEKTIEASPSSEVVITGIPNTLPAAVPEREKTLIERIVFWLQGFFNRP